MSVLRYRDPATGDWRDLEWPAHTHGETSSGRLVGEVVAYAGTTPPPGWLVCDGSTISEATYPALFAVLGSTYGAPGRLPDLRGRSPLGSGGATAPNPGQTAGAATHGHVGNALAAHTHSDPATTTSSDSHSHTTDIGSFTSGSGGSHSHSTGYPSGSEDVREGTGALNTPASGLHTHGVNSGGSHTHSVNPPSTRSSSDAHSHTTAAHNVSSVSAGTPSVQAGSSFHPVLSLLHIIYAG